METETERRCWRCREKWRIESRVIYESDLNSNSTEQGTHEREVWRCCVIHIFTVNTSFSSSSLVIPLSTMSRLLPVHWVFISNSISCRLLVTIFSVSKINLSLNQEWNFCLNVNMCNMKSWNVEWYVSKHMKDKHQSFILFYILSRVDKFIHRVVSSSRKRDSIDWKLKREHRGVRDDYTRYETQTALVDVKWTISMVN